MASRYETKSKGSLHPPGEDVVMFPDSRTVYSPDGTLREIYRRSLRDPGPKRKPIDKWGYPITFGLEERNLSLKLPVEPWLTRERLEKSLRTLLKIKTGLRANGQRSGAVESLLEQVRKSLELKDSLKDEKGNQKEKR